MNPQITTLDPVTTATNAKTILSKDGFTCSLLMLAPGDETPRREGSDVEEHVLFVVEGEATVRFHDVNTMLSRDEALLIPKGREHIITAHPGVWGEDSPYRRAAEKDRHASTGLVRALTFGPRPRRCHVARL